MANNLTINGDLFGPFATYQDDRAMLIHGDMREALRLMPAESVDSAVMDPPYHLTSIQQRYLDNADDSNSRRASNPASHDAMARLSKGFMGKTWDGGDVAFQPETWAEVYRVLKPGAHLIAFGGTRTVHLMTTAIEAAGFAVRDRFRYQTDATDKYGPLLDSLTEDQRAAVIELLHESTGGSELAWTFGSGFPKSHDAGNGWGTGIKPAYEPIIMARKPLIGTVAENVLEHGTGALNIDGCRIFNAGESTAREYVSRRLKPGAQQSNGSWKQDDVWHEGTTKEGRHPANLITDGSGFGFPVTSGGGYPAEGAKRTHRATYGKPNASGQQRFTASSGNASRFFYSAKANKADRNGSSHPTVKPIDLVQWLQRLITPPGGTTLDGFAGSGTAITAALREGFKIIAIEREAEYFCDMLRRVR